MRLINADALKLYIDKEVEEDKVLDSWAFFFKVYLDNAPSIDIDRPQGEWIADKHKNIWDMDVDCYRCSNCGSRAINHSLIMDTTGLSYCPNCGARMKGADDECR